VKPIFEAEIFPGIALYDATDVIPQHPTESWDYRSPSGIDVLFVHHSGALGRMGLRGYRASAQYSIDHSGWPGTAYHLWAPYHDVRDAEGRTVIYRGQPDDAFSWHTGGANRRGMGLALQGDPTETGPSPSQVEILEAVIPWWMARFGTTPKRSLSWHSDSDRHGGRPKASCPGPVAVEWLRSYRDGS